MEVIRGREAVLAATGHSPYALLNTHGDVSGYHAGGTTAWVDRGATNLVACALGDPARAVELLARADAAWLHLPRATTADLAGLRIGQRDEWEFLWTAMPPPPRDGEENVTRLTPDDEPEMSDMLANAFPDTTTRPGDPRVRAWFGIRERGRIVACAADRSRGGVGFLAGLAVAPDQRGRGLGAALTAAVARLHLAGYGVSTLGVLTTNTPALRLYRALGYAESLPRTSVRLTP